MSVPESIRKLNATLKTATAVAMTMYSDYAAQERLVEELRVENFSLRAEIALLRSAKEVKEVKGLPDWSLVPNAARVKYVCSRTLVAMGTHLTNGRIFGDDGVTHDSPQCFALHECDKFKSQRLVTQSTPVNPWEDVHFLDPLNEWNEWKPFNSIRTRV